MEIRINRIKLRGYHGVFPQERAVGQDFEVSLRLDIKGYDGSDRLATTVNYAEVIDVVKEQMAIPSGLIEHVCQRIVLALREQFPAISGGEVTIIKLRPPVEAELESVSVTLKV